MLPTVGVPARLHANISSIIVADRVYQLTWLQIMIDEHQLGGRKTRLDIIRGQLAGQNGQLFLCSRHGFAASLVSNEEDR